MKLYVLVSKDKEGKPTFDMPKHFGRSVRAYRYCPKALAKKFDAIIVELDVENGTIVND